jgi:hypothetical protein
VTADLAWPDPRVFRLIRYRSLYARRPGTIYAPIVEPWLLSWNPVSTRLRSRIVAADGAPINTKRDVAAVERCGHAAGEPPAQQALYFFGGLIMMCAPAVPGAISHGAPSLALVDRPVDWGVAKGT